MFYFERRARRSSLLVEAQACAPTCVGREHGTELLQLARFSLSSRSDIARARVNCMLVAASRINARRVFRTYVRYHTPSSGFVSVKRLALNEFSPFQCDNTMLYPCNNDRRGRQPPWFTCKRRHKNATVLCHVGQLLSSTVIVNCHADCRTGASYTVPYAQPSTSVTGRDRHKMCLGLSNSVL